MGVDPGEADDGYRAVAGHRLLSMLLYGGPGARLSACAATLMRLHGGPISSASTPMQPTNGRMGSVCFFCKEEEAEYTASLAFGIAVSASWWAARMGLAQAGGDTGCRLTPEVSGSGQ